MLQKTISYMTLRAGISILSMMLLFVIIRLLGPSETGKLMLVVAFVQGVMLLLALGTDNALTKFVVAVSRHRALQLYTLSLRFALGGSVVLAVILAMADHLNLLPSEIVNPIVLVFVLCALYCLVQINVYMLRGLGQLNLSSVFDGGVEIAPRLMMVPLLVIGTASYQTYLDLLLIALIAFAVVSCWFIWKRLPVSPKKTVTLVKGVSHSGLGHEYWRFALYTWLGALILLIYYNISLWILRYALTPVEVGYYALTSRVPVSIIALFLTPIGAPLLYYFTARSIGLNAINRSIVIVSTAIGCGCLVLAGNAPWLVSLFGKDFLPAIPAFIVLVHLPFVIASQSVLNPWMLSKNHVVALNALTVLMLVAMIGLDIWLIPGAKHTGAAAALIISQAFGTLCYGFYLRHQVPGLLRTLVTLYVLYIPLALLATTGWWPITVIGFPCMLLAVKALHWTDVKLVGRELLRSWLPHVLIHDPD